MKGKLLLTFIGILVVATIVGRLTGHMIGSSIAEHSDYNKDSCMKNYVVPAKSEQIARVAASACTRISDSGASQEEKDWARCVLPQIANIENDLGANVVATQCWKK